MSLHMSIGCQPFQYDALYKIYVLNMYSTRVYKYCSVSITVLSIVYVYLLFVIAHTDLLCALYM